MFVSQQQFDEGGMLSPYGYSVAKIAYEFDG